MEKKKRVFYVEDDQALSFLTSDSLRMKGFDVTLCEDGEKAWEKFQKETFDICILDIMLPKMDGFMLAEKIREINQDIPIIFLTAKSMLDDKINGLKIGGDDYIIKPFSLEELVLKMEIFLRRNKKINTELVDKLAVGSYELIYHQLVLRNGNNEQKLTTREADLLFYFYQNKNQIIKREEILKEIWGNDDYFLGRSLDVFISRLRKYLKEDPQIQIENVHSVGFIFKCEEK